MPVTVKVNVDNAVIIAEIPRIFEVTMADHSGEILATVQALWSGWKNSTGNSRDGFEVTVRTDAIVIANRENYAGYVHRSGSSTPYIETVIDQVQDDEIDAMMDDIAERILLRILEG